MRYDARVNRERILAAAESVFGEQGAAGSTEEIARRAGVGVATVFRHFPTKVALIEATLLAHFDDLRKRAEELAGAGDPGDALRALIRVMIETGATKLTLVSLLGEDGDVPASVVTASGDVRAVVDSVLRRAQSAGSVRASIGVDEVYLLIRALAQASATRATPSDTVDRAIDIVLTGIAQPR